MNDRPLKTTPAALASGGTSRRDVIRWVFVAAVTFAMGQADRLFLHHGLTFGTLILAPGCLLPFILWWGVRYWTAALCGALLTLLFLPGIRTVAAQMSIVSIPAIAAGFAVELGLTVWLLRRWGFQQNLSRGRDALLLMFAALLGTMVSGWVVMPVVYWPEAITWSQFLFACAGWWLMHLVSIIVFTPAFLTWRRWQANSPAEWGVLAAMLIGLVQLETIGMAWWALDRTVAFPVLFASLPLVLWGVLRYGMRSATVIVVATTVLAGYATAQGEGPLFHPNSLLANFLLNLFLLSFGATFNLVGCFAEERRDLFEQLKIELALLAKAEELAGVGSWQVDVVSGQERWSRQFYQQLGLMPDEIPAEMRVFRQRFVVPHDRLGFETWWDSFIRTGQPDRVEVRILRTDNRERLLVGQADIQRDLRERPVRYVGTLRDITERRQALDDRQRMQDQLNKAQELASLGSWEIDSNGFMPSWSDNMYRLHGVEHGDFDGKFATYLERFVHPDDREPLWQRFQDYRDGTGPDWADFRVVLGDGAVRDMHAHVQIAARRDDGQLIRGYGTSTDVTERKQAERLLRESEQRYRLLADHSSDLITRIRDDGRIVYASPACQTILGYEPSELVGRTMIDFVSAEDRSLCRQMIGQLFTGETHSAVAFRGRRHDGSSVWLESKSQLLTDEAGRRELLSVIRDITERRSLEEQVAQAQRLEAVGRLSGGIAHDFNNILLVINGYAEILELRFPPGDPAAKYVANILEAGRRAALLTRQLLTYSRKQLVSRDRLNLNEIISQLGPLLDPLLDETIELVLKLDPDLGTIEGSAAQFEQLLVNLAINARDAMSDGGRLMLETRNVRFSPAQIRPGKLPAGGYVVLIVTDTGQGMDEAVKAHLFEPFFTTKQVGEGTGLGLATVHSTVEQCGGAILVESSPGAGTRFELYFPALESVLPIAPLPDVPPPPTLPDAGDRRILVVEDEGQVRSLVEYTLQQANYRVVTASGSDEAIRLVENDPQGFDLLLTDVVMKGANGRELAERLRRKTPDLAVIFMSGHTEDAVLKRGVLHDELTFLQKPFTSEVLLNRVREIFARQVA